MGRRALCVPLLVALLGMFVFVVGCGKKAEKAAQTPVAKAEPAPMAKMPSEEAEAPAGPAAAPAAQVSITAEKIKNWMACMKDLEKEAPELKSLGKPEKPDTQPDWAKVKAALEKAAAEPKVEACVKRHGFADGKQWAAFTGKMFAGMTQMAGQMGAEMAKSLGGGEKSEGYKKAKAEIEKMTKGVEKAFGKLTDAEMKALMSAMEELGKQMGEQPTKEKP